MGHAGGGVYSKCHISNPGQLLFGYDLPQLTCQDAPCPFQLTLDLGGCVSPYVIDPLVQTLDFTAHVCLLMVLLLTRLLQFLQASFEITHFFTYTPPFFTLGIILLWDTTIIARKPPILPSTILC